MKNGSPIYQKPCLLGSHASFHNCLTKKTQYPQPTSLGTATFIQGFFYKVANTMANDGIKDRERKQTNEISFYLHFAAVRHLHREPKSLRMQQQWLQAAQKWLEALVQARSLPHLAPARNTLWDIWETIQTVTLRRCSHSRKL